MKEFLPLTAWEQAVIICLFVLAAIIISRIVSAADTKRRAEEDKRNHQLMEFIERRDKDWQGFLKQTRQEDSDRHDHLADILNRLAKLMENHDVMTREAVARMEERTRPRNPSRSTK